MKAWEMRGSKITIRGNLERVVYKSPDFESGDFAIFKIRWTEIMKGELPSDLPDPYLLTFSGEAPSLKMGASYTICGELNLSPKWGAQYKVGMMSLDINIETRDGLAKFLAYIITERNADAVLSLPDPIRALEEKDIKSLTSVKGIGIATANKIISAYSEQKFKAPAYIELFEYGLTKNMLDKLCAAYKSPEVVIEKIKQDPYILIYEVRGIGWNKADELARTIGIEKNDDRRVKAYIYYVLQTDANDNGNTYMIFEDLLGIVAEMFGEMPRDKIRECFIDLIQNGRVFVEKETRRIGLLEYRKVEQEIAAQIHRIASAPAVPIRCVDEAIEICQKETGFIYSDEQRKAIYKCLNLNMNIVSGNAGTGKTSVMYPVVKALELNHMYVAQCALSGKAALNLTEVTHKDGSTIHRLLGFDADKGEFNHNSKNPLDYDVIILDETSMVDEFLFLSLISAIRTGSKLIMLGDTGQLEPIGVGCILRDLIECGCINHIEFTKIFRQAERSGIISEAAKVYKGQNILTSSTKAPEVRGELRDFEIVPVVDADKILYTIVDKFRYFLNDCGANIEDIVVVTGKRVVGSTSTRAINTAIQKMVNGVVYGKHVAVNKVDNGTQYTIDFRVGDRVLVTKNCYDTTDLKGNKSPVFNGNLGTIQDIDDGGMTINFLQGTVFFPQDKYLDLELGYAITCHKCQGSGIPYVITVCDCGSYMLLSKEWLYTAITRAKKYNVLIAQPRAVARACQTTSIVYKRTWLKDFIVEEFEGDEDTI